MEDWNNTTSNVDVFRNMPYTTRTRGNYNFLQFILIYDEHNVLVGANNMVDIVWDGIIWHYNDIADFSKKNVNIANQMECGVSDAVYLTNDKFVVVGDSGDVEIFQIIQTDMVEQSQEFRSLHSARQHDDSILTVSIFSNKRNIVTGGMDGCIKIWDTEDLMAIYSYETAHVDIINSIDVKPTCNSTFVSVGSDGAALLWDIRQSKPAHCLLESNCQLSTITWNTSLDHLVAIGGDNGITLMDIRESSDPLHFKAIEYDRGIRKLLFNPDPERKEQLACCFEGCVVKVYDSNNDLCSIFEDNTHLDFVQGLAWYKDNLFSCSWDGSVIKHVITNNN